MKNQGFINCFQAEKAQGNAFVIILIIIALMAALTITFTRMSDNTSDVSQEQAQTIASQILRQGKTLENAVAGLTGKGCSINQLSFENSIVTGYTNAQSPSDKSCLLFNVAGAGLNFPTSPFVSSNSASIWHFSRTLAVPGIGADRETRVNSTYGTCPSTVPNCQDLIAVLPFVDLSVCKALNLLSGVTSTYETAPPKQLGVFPLTYKFNAPSTSPTIENFSSLPFNSSGNIMTNVTTTYTNPFWEKRSGCLETADDYRDPAGAVQAGAGKYFFYQVLYER